MNWLERDQSGALSAARPFKEADIKTFFTEKYKVSQKRGMLQNRLGLAPPAVWLSGADLTHLKWQIFSGATLTHVKWQILVLRKISTGELDGGGGKYKITNVANMKSQMWQIWNQGLNSTNERRLSDGPVEPRIAPRLCRKFSVWSRLVKKKHKQCDDVGKITALVINWATLQLIFSAVLGGRPRATVTNALLPSWGED